MKISIGQPLGYSHIGKKDNQEDSVWPELKEVTIDQRIFLLCDGVGGIDHGEVASQIVSTTIGKTLSHRLDRQDIINDLDIQEAVKCSYDELNKVASSDGKQMATTLTCVVIDKDGIITAHMGDSRIYHVRPKVGIIHQSEDHSLVNALIKSGELTQEEAKSFPRKNVITKAIQARQTVLNAEIKRLSDIKTGDYIFLCSDGVIEHLTNAKLFEILSSSVPDMVKIKMLETESAGITKDNFTAYLIPIVMVEENDKDSACVCKRRRIPAQESSSSPIKRIIGFIAFVLIIVFLLAFVIRLL